MSFCRKIFFWMVFLGGFAVISSANAAKITFHTSEGDIVVELFPAEAPKTVENIIEYVEMGHYDGLLFHRIIPNFVIQVGGFEPGMKQRIPKRRPIKNEADNGLKNTKYSLSMARTNKPHTATSQFFINLKDNENLDHHAKNDRGWGYAVFGQVVGGKDVVDRIATAKTGSLGPYKDVPEEDIIIEKAVYEE